MKPFKPKNPRFRKYREISAIYLKSQLAWRADAVFQMLFTVTKILFAYLLWGMVFSQRDTVSGFTLDGMLSYYIISSFLSQLELSDGVSGEVSERIRNGTFSKYMVLPVNIPGYVTAMEAGCVLFYLGFDLAAALIWIFIFRIRFVFTHSPLIILCALLMIILGLLFMVQLNYYLGLLTLKYEEIGTFLMIKSNLVALITGSIVPLALFPEAVLRGMKLLPFYYITYLPSMLLTGRCREEAVTGILILCLWCLALGGLIRITWKKYRVKYDGAGI